MRIKFHRPIVSQFQNQAEVNEKSRSLVCPTLRSPIICIVNCFGETVTGSVPIVLLIGLIELLILQSNIFSKLLNAKKDCSFLNTTSQNISTLFLMSISKNF